MIKDLPALDDVDLRKKNTERLVNSVGEVGDFFKELKKQNRITFIIAGISSLLVLVFLGSIVYAAFTIPGSGFMENMVDKNLLAQRYNCTSGQGQNAYFRTPTMAKEFLSIYENGTCDYYDIRTKVLSNE